MFTILDTDITKLYKLSNIQVLERLIKKGLNIHKNNNYALRWAACKGFTQLIKILSENGADVCVNNNYAICQVAHQGNTEAVKILVKYGADINMLTIKQFKDFNLGEVHVNC